MKKILLLIGIALAVFVLVMGFLAYQTRREDPSYLLERLRAGEGDRDQLIMRFKLARGDRVEPMLAAFADSNAPAEFRTLVLDMLFARQAREADPRIPPVLEAALDDPDPAVRQQAVEGYALFGEREQQVALLQAVDDPAPDVRRQAYLVFSTNDNRPEGGIWESLDEAQRDQLATLGARMAEQEEDPQMRFLARGLVGRRVEILVNQARQSVQRGDPAGAEALLERALEIDPQNEQAKVTHVRHYLTLGDPERAVALAETYGALMRVPRLPEAPVIDGDPTDGVWASALSNDHPFYRNTSRWTGVPAEGETTMSIGHHDGRIYIAMIGYEEHLDELAVRHTEPDKDVWRDDCMEVLIDTMAPRNNLYQFIVNPLNVVEDQGDRDNSRDFRHESGAKVFKDRGYARFADAAAAERFAQRVKEDPAWGIRLGRTEQADGQVRVYYWSDDREGRIAARELAEELGGERVPPYWSCELAFAPKDLDGKQVTPETIWGMLLIRTRVGPGAEQTSWWPTYGGSWNPHRYPIAVFEDFETPTQATPEPEQS